MFIKPNKYIFDIPIHIIILKPNTSIAGYWPLGGAFCIIWNIIDDVTVLMSHFTIVFITLDRYMLVRDALSYSANEVPRRALVRIVLTWVLVLLPKAGFIIWGEWYHSQEGTQPSCSPQSHVEVPYIIGKR